MRYIFSGCYTSPDGRDGVRCFSVSPDGTLTQLCAADVYSPTYVLYHRGLVYAVGRTGAGSCVHTFDFDGKTLTERSRTPADADSSLCHLSIVGHTMYAAAYGSGRLVRFALDADGIPDRTEIISYTGSGIHPRQEHSHIHSAFPSPDARFLLVCDLGGDNIYSYQIHADGSLTERQRIAAPAGSGPRHLTYSRDGTRVYAITELSAQVIVYRRDVETGTLTQMQITSCVPQEHPDDTLSADIHLSTDGHVLYASSRGADCMAVYPVLPDGMLGAPIFQPSYASGPRNFSLSPDGQFAVIGGQYSNNIVVCPIDRKTGMLRSPIHTAAAPRATRAQWVETDR